MFILLEFVYRLSFGLALAMGVTPPKWVTSGYYRNHSYVLLGLSVLAGGVSWVQGHAVPLWPAVGPSLLSSSASVLWLYERPRPGILMLLSVAGVALYGAWLVDALAPTGKPLTASHILRWLDPLTGGLVLGVTMAAMLLGH